MARKLKLDKSLAYFRQAKRLIPLASQTFSKSYMSWSVGAAPLCVVRGKGAYVWDADGNMYIDYSPGIGAKLLGHAYPAVVRAVSAQMKRGISFSIATPLELELARLIVKHVPSAEMARFGKNGSDVTSAAVRLARAATGRDQILCSSYHGWQDWYIGSTERNLGVPRAVCRLTTRFPYGDLPALERLFRRYRGKVAGVVMEAVIHDPPPKGYLREVARMTRKNGALLIFDEVVTGFRFAMGGAQELFGVTPDLTCLGKALGNGMPIAAICGRRRYVKLLDDVFFSFTHGGEAASLAAAIAVIHELEAKPVHAHINRLGAKLNDGALRLIAKHRLEDRLAMRGYPCRGYLSELPHPGTRPMVVRTFMQQELAKRGILYNGQHLVSYSHRAADIAKTLKAYDEAFKLTRARLDDGTIETALEGQLLAPVFRTT